MSVFTGSVQKQLGIFLPLLSAGRSEIDPYKADSKIPPHRVGADVLIGPQVPANSQIPGAVVGAGFITAHGLSGDRPHQCGHFAIYKPGTIRYTDSIQAF